MSATLAQAQAQAPPANAIAVNRNSGMCADVSAASKASGQPIIQWDCHLGGNQQWTLRAVSGGYNLVNRNSGLCADIQAGSRDNGAPLIQWTCNGGDNQRFTVKPDGDWVQLVAAHSGKCLDAFNASLDGGAAIIQWPCHDGWNQEWTLSPEGPRSSWSPKIALPLVPVSASTLRSGKILAWSSRDRFSFGGDGGSTYSTVFDPATNKASERLVTETGHDMFCPGTATLADGRILVNGGSSSGKTSIYDPDRNTWSTAQGMTVPRGYQGDTVLATGEVLTLGGSWSGGEGNKVAEIWSATVGWRKLSGITTDSLTTGDRAGIYRSDNHMWLFGAANGAVFHAGPSARMNWLFTNASGSVRNAGNRGDDDDAMNGNVVMFDAGKLLKVGGASSYENERASESAYVVDFSGGPAAEVKTTKQKPMAFPRAFANAVALPNGQVVVIGGMTYPKPFSDERSITVPEIWTPSTGAFQRLAPMAAPRNYHSVATLMLDGRVWAGGGGLCGNCATNHPDAEILTPPYLLNADGSNAVRPVINDAPRTAGAGQTITVTTDRAVSSFALVRLSATTHSVNNDQRRVPLVVASSSGTSYQITLPSDAGALIQGDWMLFAMTDAGTPSIAKVVRVQ